MSQSIKSKKVMKKKKMVRPVIQEEESSDGREEMPVTRQKTKAQDPQSRDAVP